MKIIFSNYDSLNNPYYGGGGAVAVHEVAKRLAGNADVMIITGKYPNSKNETLDGVLYKRIGIASLPPQLAQLVFQFLLPFYVKKEKFDVWLESFTPPFSTAFLPLFTKKPVVGLTHLLGGEEMAKKYKLPFHIIEQTGLKYYKYCIVLTESLKKKVLYINPRIDTAVIANGVDPELLKENSEPENKHILFIGRIDVNQKGLDILIDAYKLVENEIGLPLVLVGKGIPGDEDFLKKKIVKLDLVNKVKILGRLEGEEKHQVFRQSAFLVAPSRYENFPLIVYEAFAFGLPILVSSIPGFSWVPDIASVKVDVENPKVLSKAMLDLSKNSEQRKIMGSAARGYVKSYSWEKVSDRYSEFLQTVLSYENLTNKRSYNEK